MTSGTVTAQEKKSFTQILAERDTALLDVNLTHEEFAERIELTYDDRWRRHSWRVKGDIYLYNWIYDHHQDRDEETLSDAAVIKCAYERLRAIQDRRGQVNFHSVYVKDCENVELFPRKNLDHATVRVVRDRIDRLYRYSTSYHAVNGGGEPSNTSAVKSSKPPENNKRICVSACSADSLACPCPAFNLAVVFRRNPHKAV